MMKKFLALLLTALMLLAALPLASPPALADITFDVVCSVNEPYVGETVLWQVKNITGSPGNYSYKFDIYKDNVLYTPGVEQLNPHWYFTFALPGKYYVHACVTDMNTSQEYRNNSFVISVSASPNKITKVEPVNASSLKITWNQVPGATSYRLFRSTKINSGWELVQITGGTSFTDTNLTAGTRYFYKVMYYGRPGVYILWLSPAVAGVPMGKTSITAITSPAKGQVKLVWAKAAGASGYQVLMAAGASGTYKPVRQLTGTTVTLTGLKSGAALYFKVRPYRKVYTATYWGLYSAPRSVKVK